MLADDLLATPAHAALAEQVRLAQRFTVTQEVITSGIAVLNLPIAAQLKALSVCRLPFPETWFEWPSRAGRTGVLISTDDRMQRGICQSVISRQRVVVLPAVGVFDWSETPRPIPCCAQSVSESDWNADTDRPPTLRREDWNEDVTRHGVMVYPSAPGTPEFSPRLLHGVAFSEMQMVRALILLLHTSNVTRAEHLTPPEKVQAARLKARKAPLLDRTQITISLSRELARRAGEAADPRQPMRFHLVRGHFKYLSKSRRLVWWSPHSRGSLEVGEVRHQVRKIAA